MGKGSNNSKGVGSLSLLTITFIVLKLTGVIDWSWWGVFALICIVILVAFFYKWITDK